MSSALTVIAWREILARVMQGFECQENVSPDWLVNPATKRRLKLDQLYPQVGLAVRWVGLTASGQPRQSEWELLEEEQRNQTRAELCQLAGVELFLLDSSHADPRQQLHQLRSTLSRLSRLLAQGERSDRDKLDLMPQLAAARARLDDVARRVHGPDDLAQFAELWRDRETAAAAATRQPDDKAPPRPPALVPGFHAGQAVCHTAYGPGAVVAVRPNGADTQVTVRFADGRERTFLASLAAGKLVVE